MVYIICIFLNEYRYIRDCLNICIYSWFGEGSLLLGIEPRGLYPWDIFSWPMGVSIIDIKVCTFSIGVNSFMISSIDFRVILWFGRGHIFFFYLDFIYWDWDVVSFDTEDYGHCVGWAAVPVLNISFVIYWDVVSWWLYPFLAECKILKCLSWLYLLRVMNTPCDLNPFLLRGCSNLIWLICLSRWFLQGLSNECLGFLLRSSL